MEEETSMAVTKLYLNQDNKVICSCPQCPKSRVVDASKLLGHKGQIKVRYSFCCEKCLKNDDKKNNEVVAVIERRKFYRKKIEVPGQLVDANKQRYLVLISDLSRTGIRLVTKVANLFHVDDILTVEFHLDDVNRTFIEKELTIKRISESAIEAEFTVSQSYSQCDKAIGFYLMN